MAVAVPVEVGGAVAVAVTVTVVDVAGVLDDEEHPATPAQIIVTAIQLAVRRASRPAPRFSPHELIAAPFHAARPMRHPVIMTTMPPGRRHTGGRCGGVGAPCADGRDSPGPCQPTWTGKNCTGRSGYWRPTAFASAIGVADALVWGGADSQILDAVSHIEGFGQYLVRALIYRKVTDWMLTRDQPAGHGSNQGVWAPAVDLACRLAAHH